MITEKTVFILGAGASCPYGFPSGAQLGEEICYGFKKQYLDYVKQNYSTNEERDRRRKPIEQFVDAFRGSNTNPIDLFLAGLEETPDWLEIGKYIISFKILDAEQKSHFPKIKEQDWYSLLFKRMRDTIKKKVEINKFSENNISFITFNYDRSLEHFLFKSLYNSFALVGVSEQEIKEQLEKIKIIHVYGSLAPLDWQDTENGIKYGTPITESILQKTSKNLKTLHEEKQNPELEKAKKLIAEAKKVFSLGFGYAPENMEILGLPQIIRPHINVYGTGFKLEEKEIEKIHSEIFNGITGDSVNIKYANSIKIEKDMDCLKLLRNYL